MAVNGSKRPSDVFVLDLKGGKVHGGDVEPARRCRPRRPRRAGARESGRLRRKAVLGLALRPEGLCEPGPVVLSFHGGPESQEVPSFNPTYQALLAQGIAVFAPNVRGSSGFGRTYVNADNQGKRLNVLRDVKSCVDHVVGSKLADPKRVGIMGGSYGGWVTMAALTAYPDAFAAGVDLFGIVNFFSFFAETEPWMAQISRTEYGDPETQRDLLKNLSPLLQAGVDQGAGPRPPRQERHERPGRRSDAGRRGAEAAERAGGIHPLPRRGARVPEAPEPDPRDGGHHGLVHEVPEGPGRIVLSSPERGPPEVTMTSEIAVRPEPSRFFRWLVLVFVSLGMFANYYVFDALNPVGPFLEKELGFTQAQIGLLDSAYNVAALLVLLLGGILIDRAGTKRALLLFGVVNALGGLLIALSPKFPGMMARPLRPRPRRRAADRRGHDSAREVVQGEGALLRHGDQPDDLPTRVRGGRQLAELGGRALHVVAAPAFPRRRRRDALHRLRRRLLAPREQGRAPVRPRAAAAHPTSSSSRIS